MDSLQRHRDNDGPGRANVAPDSLIDQFDHYLYGMDMASALDIPTVDFSNAKAGLSELMTDVVHHRHLTAIERHKGRETMYLLSRTGLEQLLQSCRFEPKVIVDGDEFTASLDRFGVLGFGATLEEAMEDLTAELRNYAARYFAELDFYRRTDRAWHFPWLLRFATTPVESQTALLLSDARPGSAPAR